MRRAPLQCEELLTTAEFAAAWGVCSRTVVKWDDAGYVTTRRTLGGHRRFLASETPAGRGQGAGTAEPTP
jgi:hypothetical protein